MTPPTIRPTVLPSPPPQYDRQDQTELRRAMEIALLAASVAPSSISDSSALSLSTNISVADSKAVSDSSLASVADSKGVSSGTRASTADSKSLSVSTLASTADSKAISVSANTSIADSKATSIAATSTTGTWTPTDASGASLAFTGAVGTWEKDGRQVTVRCFFTYPATASGLDAKVGGLPFTVANVEDARQGMVTYSTETALRYAFPAKGATTVGLQTSAGGSISNATMSGDQVYFTAIYYE